ncbi:hypothetical protein ACWEOW_14005 [Monashia sp. NPDC004114]
MTVLPAEAENRRRAETLKERIYVTFTSLAVVLALGSHADEVTPGSAAATLAITVTGTLLAVFVADVVAHIAVHASLPSADEFRHMLRVSIGSISVIALPLIFLAFAGAGVWETERALRASTYALGASLIAIGYLAVRRVRLPLRQRLIVLFAEFGLGVAVVLVELLAHG